MSSPARSGIKHSAKSRPQEMAFLDTLLEVMTKRDAVSPTLFSGRGWDSCAFMQKFAEKISIQIEF